MAITYLTLEESADKLGITVSEFKKRLRTEWTQIRPLQDGSTQRFKSKDIEELGRQIGIGSEEELQLAAPSDEETVPLEVHVPDDDLAKTLKPSSSKSKLSPHKSPPKKAQDDDVLPIDDEEVALGSKEIFLLADDKPKSASKKSSGKIRSAPAKPDSDVRLEQSGKIKKPTAEQNAATDEIELDILPSSSGKKPSSGKLGAAGSGKLKTPPPNKPGPKSGKLAPPPPEADSSEFELNLDADSSDEFELSLANDSDEISLGDMPAPSASDSKAGLASGINLSKPKDKGLSLEKGDGRSSKKLSPVKPQDLKEAGKSSKKLPAPKLDSDEEVDFELSLDQPGASSKKIASSKKLDGDSEFDLTLDDASDPISLAAESGRLQPVEEDQPKNDIFETDFEIPALDDDSASEAVAIEEADTDLESSSDFDLAIDEESSADVVEEESGSQVVVLDDEIDEEPKARKTGKKKKKPAAVEVEDEDGEAGVSFDDMDLDEEDMSASGALAGVRAEPADEEEEREPVVVGSAPWGVLPALFMLPTVFIVFVGGLMAYEMMHSMWGYHQPTAPSTIVIDQVADMLDLKPKDDLPVKK